MNPIIENSPLDMGSSFNEHLADLNSYSPLPSDISDLANNQLIQINQWITGVQNGAEISRHSPETMTYLNTILGPIASEAKESYARLDNELMETLTHINCDEIQNENIQEIILKINKKVFIESIDFYQKATDSLSSIMKIQLKDENRSEWVEVYKARIPIPVQSLLQLFSPKLLATSFKCDSIKMSLMGDAKMLDGIEVKGSVYSTDIEDAKKKKKTTDPLDEYPLLPRQLHSLISSDLFSDVVFEIEGKRVPAHRNILVCRSGYFRAMLSEKSKFTDATANKFTIQKPTNLIYIGDVTYDVFIQVLNFIYTGRIDLNSFSHYVSIELMRVADRMNLQELEKLCLYHLSKIINKDNVCKIYKECFEKEPNVESVQSICFEEIILRFAHISKTEDFCALPQDLMIKIVENVIPKLARVNSVQVNDMEEFGEVRPRPPVLQIPSTERHEESDDTDEESNDEN